MSKQLFRATAIVGSMTMISRVLGFVRDMLLARVFGVDAATDAFYIAFKIPNFFRRLFGEGAFAQAFVPVLSDYQQHDSPDATKRFIHKTASSLALYLFVITLLGVVAAPLLILLLAPGFTWSGGQHTLAVHMLQITFPYLFFIGLVAFASSVLNVYGKFAIPALTPVLLNIAMIAAALWFAPLMAQPIVGLAWSVFIAGVLQLLFQLPSLWRLGLMPRWHFALRDRGVKRVMGLMLPAVFGASISQINLLLDSVFASFLKPGSVSWLYYSDRLVEFPLGIFGIALATVVLPNLSRSYVHSDSNAFAQALDWGLRWVILVSVPASLGLVLLAKPLLMTMFQYGEFSVQDVELSGQSLRAYAIGLLGFMFTKILVQGFSARHDTRTPVKYGLYTLVANLFLNGVFVLPLAHAGLALATSVAAFFNAGLLFYRLQLTQIYRPEPGWRLFTLRVLLANLVMALALYYGVDLNWWLDASAMLRVSYLCAAIFASIVLYLLMLRLLGMRWRQLVRMDAV